MIENETTTKSNNKKNHISRKVWWGLEAKSYIEIAQELPSSDESLRKWIAIYAVYHLNFDNRFPWHRYYEFLENAKGSRYVAIEFTIPKSTLEINDGIDTSNVTIIYSQTMDTEEEINVFLTNKGVDPQLFTPPWTCDYPLD
ncbi:hypothetical protein [Pseudomonas alvandae]|jgi:hypothetical protein|uniref:Uncharacterized protein n=1 Tax=Pseudomonas canavaninivorans TaxID=2842348 RepID=A0ABX8QEM2_PSECO|nr:hypothetical protein [Pseudomonas alvandae]QXI53854.1 hypothetical protein KSS97_02535 [Pseudomonas alvandae]